MKTKSVKSTSAYMTRGNIIYDLAKRIAPAAIEYAEGKLSAIAAAKAMADLWYFTWSTKERKGTHIKIRIKSMALRSYYCKECKSDFKSVRSVICPKCNSKKVSISEGLRDLHDVISELPNANSYLKHDCVHSYSTGRSSSTCASSHIGSYAIYGLDFKDFFFSFTLPVLEQFFYTLFNDWKIAKCTAMCCVIPDPRLDQHTDLNIVMPIGIKPAGFISNSIPHELDRQLCNVANTNSLRYSRYSDNIYFSSIDAHIPRPIQAKLVETVNSFKYAEVTPFKVNAIKTKYKPRWRRQTILGTCVNVKLNVPKHREIKTGSALFGLYKDIESLHSTLIGTPTKHIVSIDGYYLKFKRRYKIVSGHLSYMKAINPDKYTKYLPMMVASSMMNTAVLGIMSARK